MKSTISRDKETTMIKKEECLSILENLKDEILYWEWEEDYYGSGLLSKGERVDWTLDRMNAIMDLVEKSTLP